MAWLLIDLTFLGIELIVIRQIFIALGIGCIITLWFMQHDERVKRSIGTLLIQRLEKVMGGTFEGTVEQVRIFSPSITFSQVHVCDLDDNGWSWGAQRYTMACSWLHIIMYQGIDLSVTLEDFHAHSAIKDGSLAIGKHMQKIFMGLELDLPIDLKSVIFKRANALFHDTDRNIQTRFAWHCELKKIDDFIKISGYLADGMLRIKDRIIFESLKGAMHVDIGTLDNAATALNIDCSVALPYLPYDMRHTSISGSWKGTSGSFSVKNVHEQVAIDPVYIFYNGIQSRCSIRGSVPLASIGRFMHNDAHYDAMSGNCELVCDMRYQEDGCAVTGRIHIDDCSYSNCALGSGIATFARDNNGIWDGTIQANKNTWYGLKGTWQFQEDTGHGHLKAENSDTVCMPFGTRMYIKPGLFQCMIKRNNAGAIAGDYTAVLHSSWNDTALSCEGNLLYDDMQLSSCGILHHNPYEYTMQVAPDITSSFTCNDSAGNSLLRVSNDTTNPDTLHAVIGLPFLRTLFEHTYNTCPLQMEGSLAATVKKNAQGIDIAITTVDGLIRVPQTYNVMRDAACTIHIDPDMRKVLLRDLVCECTEGRVTVNYATGHYDDAHMLSFAHVPIIVDGLMLNMEQGLLAQVSGYSVFTKKNDSPLRIAADIIIDRAYVKENVLSSAFQKNLFRYTGSPFSAYQSDTTCDITIASRTPIRIKTPFLETTARLTMHVGNSFQDPIVTGSIALLSGSLAFPYRPLYISKGMIYFLPHQLHDPSIELTAHNKIKKYNVELQVGGSLLNHHITLDAAPSLTEEQIVALLLVGSEEESLNVVMPALIMQNLQTIMFGDDQSSRTINSIFSRFLQPLSGIHVVPSFSDQTGRGGLRGAIEIDVNDRWRGLIQKNFSLTEDTRIEVEYLVSDEVSVRGVANERRDVGAEVEMRWKF